MSTNSDNRFSMEDGGSVMESPPQSMQKCTRGSPCSRPDCISCTEPTNNSHVRNLTDDLEVMRAQPTIPLNHWIIKVTKAFKTAIQTQYLAELKMLINRYERNINALSDDELDYDRTEIQQLNHDAMKLLATLLAKPIQTPNPNPPPFLNHQKA